jgi:hypothetical protein
MEAHPGAMESLPGGMAAHCSSWAHPSAMKNLPRSHGGSSLSPEG